MRNMVVANMLAKYLPQQDFVFGDISVFNTSGDKNTPQGQFWSMPASELLSDSSLLLGLSGNKPEINSANVTSIDTRIRSLYD
ncbi:MAG: hypothetical protein Nk1A_8260 [Endomicrobiia bacterium]|nr:MAG: hypothetical protein Nk1A_8260 [Endomicrobiia bacterium]